MRRRAPLLTLPLLLATACVDIEDDPHSTADVFETDLVLDGIAHRVGLTPSEEGYLLEGDIIVGPRLIPALRDPEEARGGVKELISVSSAGLLWPSGVVYYTIDPSLPNKERVYEAMRRWSASTPIRFVERTNQRDYVTFRPWNGCSAHIGRVGGQQFVNLASFCNLGLTIHEIGHTIGLFHEHTRDDRDDYVRIIWANVPESLASNFWKNGAARKRGAYDLASIMHYGSYELSATGGPTVLRRPDDGYIAHPEEKSYPSERDVSGVTKLYEQVTCPLGDGRYCGGNYVGGNEGNLYECTSGRLSLIEECAAGCFEAPAGEPDRCASNCEYGDGLYCGGNGVAGSPQALYECAGGRVTLVRECGAGCTAAPPGQNDACSTTCPLGDGLYCGGNGVGGEDGSLYECASGELSLVEECAHGCFEAPPGSPDRCAEPADGGRDGQGGDDGDDGDDGKGDGTGGDDHGGGNGPGDDGDGREEGDREGEDGGAADCAAAGTCESSGSDDVALGCQAGTPGSAADSWVFGLAVLSLVMWRRRRHSTGAPRSHRAATVRVSLAAGLAAIALSGCGDGTIGLPAVDAGLASGKADDFSPDGERAAANYQIGTFNMAGNAINKGTTEVAEATVRSVKARRPAFVALNEVCRSQFDHLLDALPAYDGVFDPVGRRCENGAAYGNAVLFKTATAELEDEPCPSASDLAAVGSAATPKHRGIGRCSFDLPTPPRLEQRRMVCVVGSSPRVVFCSTHLTNGSQRADIRRDEADEVARIVEAYAGYGGTRIVAGDFNLEFEELRSFGIGFGPPGEFNEVDTPCDGDTCRRGEPTLHRFLLPDLKIDHIFVPSHVEVRWADATFSDYSDHDPLWAGVRF